MNIFSKIFGSRTNTKKQEYIHYVLCESKKGYCLKKMKKTIVIFPDRINTNAQAEAQTKHIFTKKFRTLPDFWNYITKSEKWYLEYQANTIENIEKYIAVLAPFIVSSTNELRRKKEFLDRENYIIAGWDNLLLRHEEKSELILKERRN